MENKVFTISIQKEIMQEIYEMDLYPSFCHFSVSEINNTYRSYKEFPKVTAFLRNCGYNEKEFFIEINFEFEEFTYFVIKSNLSKWRKDFFTFSLGKVVLKLFTRICNR